MATAVDFVGSNMRLTAPSGDEDRVRELRCFTNGRAVVTCWELTPDELVEVMRSGRVWTVQLSGRTIYPMFIGNADGVREITADTGKTIPVQPGEYR